MKKEKKIYAASTELVHIDINEILGHCKEPEYWEREWTVFKCKDFDIVWHLTWINVRSRTLSSRIRLDYHGKRRCCGWDWKFDISREVDLKDIPLSHEEYSQENFERNLISCIMKAIGNLERSITMGTYDYEQAKSLEESEKERLEEIAIAFLDSENVKNESIRDAYIEKYVSDNSNFSYCKAIVDGAERKFYPCVRLLVCSWFGDEKGFNKEKNLLAEGDKSKEKIIFKIWKSRKKLESQKWRDEMEDNLESIQG